MHPGVRVLIILAAIKFGIDLLHKLIVKKPYDKFKRYRKKD